MSVGVPTAQGPAGYTILENLLEGCQVIGRDWRYLYVNAATARHARRSKADLIGRTMMECFPGIDETPVFTALRRAMEDREPSQLENHFGYPDGSSAWFELRVEPVPDGVFVLSLDITPRKRAEIELARQVERLQSLRAIDMAILGSTDFRMALETVLDETTKRLGVDVGLVLLLGPGLTSLEVTATAGFRSRGVDRLRVRVGEGLIGQAALSRRTLLVPDLSTGGGGRHEIPAALLEEGVQGCCAVPLIAKGQLTGGLVVGTRSPLQPDTEWIGFLEALAGQAAMAVDAGRSYEHLQRAHLELALAYDSTIEGWSNALDLRDRETARHTVRVAELTVELASAAGMSDEELVQVRRGALLHDIGKMGTPDAILLKKGTLTPEEFEVVRQHPVHAYNLLSRIDYLRPALDIPYCHHERWDGTGYPRGLKGEAIPLAARLFAVVDVWDALTSDRPYRARLSAEAAREHLLALAGSHLDPDAVALFLRVIVPDVRRA